MAAHLTRLQSTALVSTCKAEYQAAGVVVCVTLGLRRLLMDLPGLDSQGHAARDAVLLLPVMDCDIQGAIGLLYNPGRLLHV